MPHNTRHDNEPVSGPLPSKTVDGFGFGRIASIDGWTLESARCLGALTGFDPDVVERGYRSIRRCD